MKRRLAEIFGSGPWEQGGRLCRIAMWSTILLSFIAWPVLIFRLYQIAVLLFCS